MFKKPCNDNIGCALGEPKLHNTKNGMDLTLGQLQPLIMTALPVKLKQLKKPCIHNIDVAAKLFFRRGNKLEVKHGMELKQEHLPQLDKAHLLLVAKPFPEAAIIQRSQHGIEPKLAHSKHQCNENIGFAAKPAPGEPKS